jgi:hypothetical protein
MTSARLKVSFEQHESDRGQNYGRQDEAPFPHEIGRAGWGTAALSTPKPKHQETRQHNDIAQNQSKTSDTFEAPKP